MVLKSFLIASLAFGSASLDAQLEKLAAESKKQRPICEAFNATADKLIKSSVGSPHFKTHVLAEAALSQLKSYPGAPSAAKRANQLVLANASKLHKEQDLGAWLSVVQHCKLGPYLEIWLKLLESGSHFNFRPEKRAEIRTALLKQIDRETSGQVTIELVEVASLQLHELARLGYIVGDSAASTKSFYEKVAAKREKAPKSGPANSILDELRLSESLRTELRKLLDPILKAYL